MDGVDHKRIVDKWWMAKLNEFMGMMKAIPDGPGGSLLDTRLLLGGNHMESGDSHHSQKVPWIRAGKAGGRFAGASSSATAAASASRAESSRARLGGSWRNKVRCAATLLCSGG